MNTYLIPTTAPYVYEPYDHIYMVYATSSQEAYELAKEELSGYCIPQWLQEYSIYQIAYSMNPKNMIYFIHYYLIRKDLNIWHISK